MTMRTCPKCKAKNYSADTTEIWFCHTCKAKITKED